MTLSSQCNRCKHMNSILSEIDILGQGGLTPASPFLDKVETVLRFDTGHVGSQLNAWYVKLHHCLKMYWSNLDLISMHRPDSI